MTDESYLGDSTSAEVRDGCVELVHEFSDGRECRIRLDSLVLGEFFCWLAEDAPVNVWPYRWNFVSEDAALSDEAAWEFSGD